MDAPAEQAELTQPKPKRKYKPRPVCTDPDLKYMYKPKPGPKPKHSTRRKRLKIERTDAEQRRFSRSSHALKRFCAANPEAGAKRAAIIVHMAKTNPALASRPKGVPDGMTREMAEAAWAVARAQAEKVFKQMVQEGIVAEAPPEGFERVVIKREGVPDTSVLVPKSEAAKAETALKEAMVMALGPMGNQQTKLAALRTVLEWTKAKPATKVEATVSKAEDLLAAALADIQKDGGN